LITPANPIEQQPDLLEKKVRTCRMKLILERKGDRKDTREGILL